MGLQRLLGCFFAACQPREESLPSPAPVKSRSFQRRSSSGLSGGLDDKVQVVRASQYAEHCKEESGAPPEGSGSGSLLATGLEEQQLSSSIASVPVLFKDSPSRSGTVGSVCSGDAQTVLGLYVNCADSPAERGRPQGRSLTSLRHLHQFALTPSETPGHGSGSPSCFTTNMDSPRERPFSMDIPRPRGSTSGIEGAPSCCSASSALLFHAAGTPMGVGVGAAGGVGLQFSCAVRLSEEVGELQLVGRGGYGVVALGSWKQEGRVAVKVLLSDEDRWLDSCYKEAVLSRLLGHPGIMQTYDFQAAVLREDDVARAQASWRARQQRDWRRQQHRQQQQQEEQERHSQAGCEGGAEGGGCGGERASAPGPGPGGGEVRDLRLDSFEFLPSNLSQDAESEEGDASVDFWQVLHMLGAKAGQYVTLIIMEYAEVGTLQRAIVAGAFRESARLSRWAALRSLLVTAKEVAGGMCLLHRHHVIHGDLSASNIMLKASRVDKRGFVAKVADFGLSKVAVAGVAKLDEFAGQAHCMAPECLDSEARLASDVFSFGVLLYEMVSGKKAFAEYSPVQILAGRIAGDLELSWPPHAPAELRALAERCMAHHPDSRPSFRDIADELRRQDAEAKAMHRAHSARLRAAAAHESLSGGLGGGGWVGARPTSGLTPSAAATPHRLANVAGVGGGVGGAYSAGARTFGQAQAHAHLPVHAKSALGLTGHQWAPQGQAAPPPGHAHAQQQQHSQQLPGLSPLHAPRAGRAPLRTSAPPQGLGGLAAAAAAAGRPLEGSSAHMRRVRHVVLEHAGSGALRPGVPSSGAPSGGQWRVAAAATGGVGSGCVASSAFSGAPLRHSSTAGDSMGQHHVGDEGVGCC